MAVSDATRVELSFQQKAGIFSHDYLKCCAYLLSVEPSRYTYTKKLYSKLIETSSILEDLLDFHGAKNNRTWYYYRELCAAVRHLARAAYSLKHIVNRLPFYDLGDTSDFEKEGDATHDFLVTSLQKLAPAILQEAGKLKLPIPKDAYTVEDFPRISTPDLLKPDIDDEETGQKTRSIVKLSTDFINISKSFEDMGVNRPLTVREIRRIVPASVNEVEIRRFEMVVHNLQSAFDSYVIIGGFRRGNRRLKRLRGYFSVVLHLLEVAGSLLHLYERHLHGVGFKSVYKKVRNRLSELVDPDVLLDRTVNHALLYANSFLEQGKDLAREVLDENLERGSITVGVPETMGFHSRPSLLVAKVVQHYGGKVELVVGDHRFDAGSVLDVQWAGGKIKKENIKKVVFTGDRRALKDLAVLASVNYGEDAMGRGIELPKELDYLR
ncbi:MAG: HPr family phosphocarrier protein [Deltaproteobacteria bacterium]|nr:HPr family phosphocarrier protein [Deltaproteobacteria bacterium]